MQAAIGSETRSAVDFVSVSDGCSGCSGFAESLNEQKLDALMAAHGGEKSIVPVNVMRTQEALDMFGITSIDFFSLDTEGHELEALRGIDFSKTSVRVFCIEDNDDTFELHDILTANGYEILHRMAWDVFYHKITK